ncbi:MAG TPA: tetratricopeptide repeat protein [Pirellulaceae bacterium]|nr:tetratricopeptide repeat protein [Pirellulaceae bacterium]
MPRQIVICGKLVSMTRADAARIAAAHGDELTEHLSRTTDLVVLGGGSPPISRGGRVTPQFARVRRLLRQGVLLKVVPEEQWLDELGLTRQAEGVRGSFTANQLAEMLKLPRPQLDRWIDAGLIRATGDNAGLPQFDFRQVAAARLLVDLAAAGIRLNKVRRAVAQLSRWLPGASDPLAELCLEDDAGRLIVRTKDGRAAEPSGQLLMDFEPPADAATLAFCQSESDADAFRRAVDCEELDPLAAAALYRQLIAAHGPHATLAFNLGNALYAADDLPAAVEQLRHATALDPGHAGAWNNLANLLAESDQLDEASSAYRRALALDPDCSEARFNLAQTLVELGRADEAVLHWRAYLAADADSTWADYARERLEERG